MLGKTICQRGIVLCGNIKISSMPDQFQYKLQLWIWNWTYCSPLGCGFVCFISVFCMVILCGCCCFAPVSWLIHAQTPFSFVQKFILSLVFFIIKKLTKINLPVTVLLRQKVKIPIWSCMQLFHASQIMIEHLYNVPIRYFIWLIKPRGQSSMILYTCATKHFQNNPLTSLVLYQKTMPKQVLAQF